MWAPLASLAAGLAALMALAAAGALRWEHALPAAATITLLFGLSVLLVLLRRVDRLARLQRRETQARKSQTRAMIRRFQADRAKVIQSARDERARSAARQQVLLKESQAGQQLVEQLVADLRQRLDAVTKTVASAHREDLLRLMQEQKRRFKAAAEHVTRQGRRDYEQHVAWCQLHSILRPDRTMPALRGWAVSPDVLCLLVESIRQRSPRLVVECGSGASTVWMGLALRRFGGGRLVALEHDEEYAARSRSLVSEHELSSLVEVRFVPLRPWTADADGQGETQLWYDVDAVADLDGIDLLLVDGPPVATGPLARYPAGPVLFPRCSPRCMVVLDDTDRADEQAASDRWVEAYPDFQRSTIDTEKGTHVLIRGS